MTECTQQQFSFQALGRRKIVADFAGGTISSDGGGLLLKEVERARGWIRDLAGCFDDHRNPALIEHSVSALLKQRLFGLALGYEDVSDHDTLRADPLLAVVCDKADPVGEHRRSPGDRGKPLAGKSTLNRLEHGRGASDRYKKIVVNHDAVADLFVAKFISRHPQLPVVLMLDLDATDDPLHGQQEGRFFHGYYGGYCYLPLYIFCGSELLCAKLRPANIDASEGALEQVQRIVARLREARPEVQIILRADSGFARDEIMSWCEDNGVDYVFGLARNARLENMLAPAMACAKRSFEFFGQSSRAFMELSYRTLGSWSRSRRVVGKAEYLDKGANPRFIVTSLSAHFAGARYLYEGTYCGRGDMENRIKEQQLDLFADRTSTATLAGNQLRLWLSAIAYSLVNDLRELGLATTHMAKATCGTIRVRLLKIGAQVRVSVRRVLINLASSFPLQDVFTAALHRMQGLACESS